MSLAGYRSTVVFQVASATHDVEVAVLGALVVMGGTVQHAPAPPVPLERSIICTLVSIGEFSGN
eukprot:CAMPEP_0183483068 /NCGR_PEP_ID=MMETSP0370-20130417/177733_1 /TAXON_ID=268820 /ORGANISM="Peridinium aciculiferum, Strain PAER-2" /LENGTH=63 /DNA_ID=CAMNT_0025676301 /DNA_START=1 /DNA_END=192 /DNA_ORIENTATION=-